MSGESQADVYASFGAKAENLTGASSLSEHDTAMLELDVDVRDGDDSIHTEIDNKDDPYNVVDPFADPDAPDDGEGRMQIRVNTEGDNEEFQPEGDENEQAGEDADGESEGEDFQPLGDVPQELQESSESLQEHENGFNEMVDQAAERGLTEESITRIRQEYEEDGISEKSYEELAAAGYSKGFIDSYIKGQEAIVQTYVNQVMEFAGGKEKFQQVHKHLEATNPDAAKSLENALQSRDLSTVKAIINLAGASRAKTFGKPQVRTLTTQAKPQVVTRKAPQGFATQAEMIKAMSDSRYRNDAAYRHEVEQKVRYSNI